MAEGEPRQRWIFGRHDIQQLLHVGRGIGPKMHAGLAKPCLGYRQPVAPEVAGVDPTPVFREMTRKAIVPPAMFGNAVSQLNDRLGGNFGRRQPLANGYLRTIDDRGNVIVHRLHGVARCRFGHVITTDIRLGAWENIFERFLRTSAGPMNSPCGKFIGSRRFDLSGPPVLLQLERKRDIEEMATLCLATARKPPALMMA